MRLRAGLMTGCLLILGGCHKRSTKAAVIPQTIPAPAPVPPPVPASKAPRRARPAKPLAVPAAAVPPPETPSPRLGQMLSPSEQTAYNGSIDADLKTARQSLANIGTAGLSVNDNAVRRQVEGFINQAERMRGTDLLAARALAHKAAVLAGELLPK